MTFEDALKLLPIERFRNPPPVVAVVRFDGVIGPRQWRDALSLAATPRRSNGPSRRPAQRGGAAINSPGGSPVQSALLYRRIRQLADEKNVPVFAFAEDVAASGGYWLALAGDEIYAEEASLLGSIGVVTASFGCHRLIERLGIERRLHTAGDTQSDARPVPAGGARRRRAARRRCSRTSTTASRTMCAGAAPARSTPPTRRLFSGDVLTGRMALARGLIDGIGDMRSVMRARFGDNVRLVPIAHRAAPALVAAAAAAACRARTDGADRRCPRLARSARALGPFRPVSRFLGS